MNRRDAIKLASAAPVSWSAAGTANLTTETVRLKLRHTWTTTMSSSEYRDNVYCRFSANGITGVGEAAPILRYKENAATVVQAIESIKSHLISTDPQQFTKVLDQLFSRIQGQWAAKAAIDIALMDWVGQSRGVPLYRYFGLDKADAPITTFSIGIDTPEITRKKVLEAAPFPVLKIKVGLDKDEATIDAVRSVTKKPLRVDANEGFKSKEEAVRKINWLETQGAEFIEQPLPAHMVEEARWVRSKVHIPILADEAVLRAEDVATIAGAYDGVVIKLDKTGGIMGALRMIHVAKAHKMKTMLGCMISSSVSITAAAHLSPLVDYADLDGNLLIANDPFRGVLVREGKLILPDRPGLGLQKSLVPQRN